MTMCDTCLQKGSCCRGLILDMRFPYDMHPNEVYRHLAEGTDPFDPDKKREKCPNFAPIQRVHFHFAKDGKVPATTEWMFTCTQLDYKTGLCKIYEDRPQVCRDYEAGSSPLCFHYTGWERYITS